jgi:hypothetical protein
VAASRRRRWIEVEVHVAERRKHPRFAKQIRVRWQRVDAAARDAAKVGPLEATQSRDVSRGGLSFYVAAEIAVDTVLAIELDREFGGPPLSALARVARCARDEKGLYVGVEFTWIECAAPETTLGLSPENAWTLL